MKDVNTVENVIKIWPSTGNNQTNSGDRNVLKRRDQKWRPHGTDATLDLQ
jgi:hypothetical protein